MAKIKETKNSVKKASSFEQIQQAIFDKLRELGLPPFTSREMAARLQKLKVLPTAQIYKVSETNAILVEGLGAKYKITPPRGVDFFGAAKLEIVD